VVATIIGWYVGLRIAPLKRSTFVIIIVVLLMTLALPSYAVYYAWWQIWPTGTWFHRFVVQHDLLLFAMKVCAFLAFVGWSWPIPACIAALSNRKNNGLLLLQNLDGTSLCKRIILRVQAEKKVLFASVIVVVAITASNTTCFDLAQVSTVGNELRAVVASGGSYTSAPWLSFSGILVAIIASFVFLRSATIGQHQSNLVEQKNSILPIVIVWILLTGGPLLLSAISSLGIDGLQLWSQYKYDLLMSGSIATIVAVMASVLVLTSMSMQLSTSKSSRYLANCLDFFWILFACLPSSMLASIVGNAWHLANLDFVDRTPFVLILAQLAKIGFVGSIAGRWAASCQKLQTLFRLDAPKSFLLFIRAANPRLVQAICITIVISFAMSIGETVLTSELAPPTSNHPISVALLNAMHYQRPQIVTSMLFVLISFVSISGVLLIALNKKFTASLLLACVLFSCQQHEEAGPLNTKIIGGAGFTDGNFMTPRAIDSDENTLVVIDKTGRLQRFSHDGTFLSSWDLKLSGTGFPTGVSIDDEGNIWIADTHQHRILVLSPDGKEMLSFGEYGTDDGQFLYPTDIAFGVDGEVYVSEYGGNDRISVFDKNGKFLRSMGHHGEDRNGFRRPQSIAVDTSTGYLYVADSGNHRIVVRSPSGDVINIISGMGRQQTQMLYPYGILVDSPNSFLVCEFGTNRLQRFTMDGQSVQIWGSAGSNIGFFRTPWGIARTSDGIVVVDTGNNRLQLLPDMMTTQ
jgi:DNA-binding beta-propeller fold protein YncE